MTRTRTLIICVNADAAQSWSNEKGGTGLCGGIGVRWQLGRSQWDLRVRGFALLHFADSTAYALEKRSVYECTEELNARYEFFFSQARPDRIQETCPKLWGVPS